MDKPLKCGQKWDDMSPADGGRVCSQCSKLIIDFSKSKWRDIEKRQAENSNSLCGLYSSQQLKYWGQEPPFVDLNFKRPIVFSSFLLTFFSATPNVTISQTKPSTSVFKNESDTEFKQIHGDSTELKTILKGHVFDKVTNESMPYASVGIRGTKVFARTDSLGNYSLDISSVMDTTETLSVLAFYINYQTGEEIIREKFRGTREINFGMTSSPGPTYSVEEPKKKPFAKIRRWFSRK